MKTLRRLRIEFSIIYYIQTIKEKYVKKKKKEKVISWLTRSYYVLILFMRNKPQEFFENRFPLGPGKSLFGNHWTGEYIRKRIFSNATYYSTFCDF